MAIRTHIGRPMDFSSWSNRVITGLVGAALLGAGFLFLTGAERSVWWTPVYVGAAWALGREIDPDHEWTAIAAGVGAGAWMLAGNSADALFATLGFMIAARIVTNTTGRRPLLTDYMLVGVLATVLSGSVVGWVAGFSIAVAMYIDDRMADESRPMAVVAAGITALAASAVATASGAFPQEVPDSRSALVIGIGLLTLIAVVREPEPPVSLVDSRRKNLLVPGRLHASRSLVAVGVFAAAFLSGPDAMVVVPAALTVLLAIVSNEAERLRRRSG